MLTPDQFNSDYAPGTELQAKKVQTAHIVTFFSDITCGEGCWEAKEDVCRCSCGGKNHGINLRGGNAKRTAKINGYRYELHSVGKYKDLREQVEQLIRDQDVASGEMKFEGGNYFARSSYDRNKWFLTSHIRPTRYNIGRKNNRYVLKYASLPQCLKWKELGYFEIATNQDRYHAGAAILWQQVTE